ncbi:hypothetical protein CDHC03_1349 [Corynebacterium diphtheriae HC03]|nr:hypothetical protein CDHC03_1349 [Corynebacterium diphtheriae HC03]AEX81342.1 hypothetical protein CDHC04_1349 [Corynebacterium diphtheriae HC04]AEX83580.1 hypothetical protein CDVA01_1311 [Corynebacterium diphtheriae VA01]
MNQTLFTLVFTSNSFVSCPVVGIFFTLDRTFLVFA